MREKALCVPGLLEKFSGIPIEHEELNTETVKLNSPNRRFINIIFINDEQDNGA